MPGALAYASRACPRLAHLPTRLARLPTAGAKLPTPGAHPPGPLPGAAL